MKKIIIASTSTLYNGDYLDYLLPELQIHFKEVKELIFIPFARPGGISYDEYTAKVSSFFANFNIQVKGIHEFENPKQAIAMHKQYLLEAAIHLFWLICFMNMTCLKVLRNQ